MALPQPEAGLVVCYAYVWHAEHMRGREDGLKDRPCAIVVASKRDGGTIVTVVPITHSPPAIASEAVELPTTVKARLGLDTARSWAVVSEVNRFVWPGSDLRPISRDKRGQFDFGFLPPSLFCKIKEGIAACAKAQRLKAVNRTE